PSAVRDRDGAVPADPRAPGGRGSRPPAAGSQPGRSPHLPRRSHPPGSGADGRRATARRGDASHDRSRVPVRARRGPAHALDREYPPARPPVAQGPRAALHAEPVTGRRAAHRREHGRPGRRVDPARDGHSPSADRPQAPARARVDAERLRDELPGHRGAGRRQPERAHRRGRPRPLHRHPAPPCRALPARARGGDGAPRRVIAPADLAAQEAAFARAFAAHDVELMRDLYDEAVGDLSPTVRLYDSPRRLEGGGPPLEFIAPPTRRCEPIRYQAVASAIAPAGQPAFVLVHFDWTLDGRRLRSRYTVVYHYRGRRIAQQEVCYDPSAPPEVLASDAPP